ncbi:GTP-binding protein YPTC1 [Nymphaea colorata]|nr:GTP-binding protein YPTC1 [Nymphaea colorata]
MAIFVLLSSEPTSSGTVQSTQQAKLEGERCKILLLGESAVGKTSLFRRYIGEPTERVTPTIGVEYKQKVIELGGRLMKVQLWDTAGTERFRTITPIYYRNVDGVLLVFDLTDKASFRSIQYWID